MGIYDRDWYQQEQKEKERRAYGSTYQNSFGWYYKLRGHEFGPCDKDNIMRLLRERTLNENTLVRKGTVMQWMPIKQLKYEFPPNGSTFVKQTPHTLPLKNDWAWLLAITPIWFALISFLATQYHLSSTIQTLCCIVFETVVALADMKRARDAGYNTKNWIWIMYLWTPAYLIQRSLKTDHQKGYMIVGILISLIHISITLLPFFIPYLA